MQQFISKSQFKSQVLEYLRNVEKEKQPLIITHGRKPVVKIVPYKDAQALRSLRNTVTKYKNPTEPVGKGVWEAAQ